MFDTQLQILNANRFISKGTQYHTFELLFPLLIFDGFQHLKSFHFPSSALLAIALVKVNHK